MLCLSKRYDPRDIYRHVKGSPSPTPRKVEETEDEKWAATEPGAAEKKAGKPDGALVAEALWSGAEWAVAPRFDHPRATVLVLLLG